MPRAIQFRKQRGERLNRLCRVCDKKFLPTGKWNKVCDKCMVGVEEKRAENRRRTNENKNRNQTTGILQNNINTQI